jgi:hypothetical protein
MTYRLPGLILDKHVVGFISLSLPSFVGMNTYHLGELMIISLPILHIHLMRILINIC